MCGEILRFPDGFLWGTVTSAHQVEGNNRDNDWWEWEKQTGRIADGSASGEACGHYDRFEEDFALLRSLGANAHRLSIEWSRLEPEEGIWDDAALGHYQRVLESLRSKGIIPFVTLHHYTTPLWLARRGGWESDAAVEVFERYARRAVQAFGAYAQHWITINAPVLYAYRAYVAGLAPPAVKSRRRALRACRNLVKAHVRAYHGVHDEAGKAGLAVHVGLAKTFKIFDPLRKDLMSDRLAALTRDYFFNELVPNSLYAGILGFPLAFNRYVPEMEDCVDFVGVNYYTREMTRFSATRPLSLFAESTSNPEAERAGTGPEIYPEGLYRILERVAKFGKPVYITENGIATDDDEVRYRFIVSHLKQVHDAIQFAGDVRGYFYYSLMDGFEWHEGYSSKTGLIEVLRANLERRIRPSGRLYSRICRRNALPAEVGCRYCTD